MIIPWAPINDEMQQNTSVITACKCSKSFLAGCVPLFKENLVQSDDEKKEE